MPYALREGTRAPAWPDAETFWQYAGDAYGEADVAAACLEAQDRYGADVNLMLFCLWMDARGLRVQGDDWGNLLATSQLWQRETLRPHRDRRRALKGKPGYDTAKQEELALERQAQAALLDSLEEPPVAHATADSLLHYFEAIGADVSPFHPND
jgi:uncharacterized protein (TIGR02444 family)